MSAANLLATSDELARWVAAQGGRDDLTVLDVYVLFLLAVRYGNRESLEAWPSVPTLASHCPGLKVRDDGTCSAIYASLARLRRAGLISAGRQGQWRNGRRVTVRRILLPQPSVVAEGNKPPPTTEPYADPQPTPYRPTRKNKQRATLRDDGGCPGARTVIPLRIPDPDFPDALPAKPCVCGGRPGADGNCSKCGRATGRAAA